MYTIDSITWTSVTSMDQAPYDNSTDEAISHSLVSGTFSSAQLMDDGVYQCNVSLYGRYRLYNTTLHVIGEFIIIINVFIFIHFLSQFLLSLHLLLRQKS